MRRFLHKRACERRTSDILLVYRVTVFMIVAIFVFRLNMDEYKTFIYSILLLALCVYEVLVALIYRQVMKQDNTRLLLCSSDALIALFAITFTGGINSPFMLYAIISVFTLHFIYRGFGLILSAGLYLIGLAAIQMTAQGFNLSNLLWDNPIWTGTSLLLSIVVFYALPYLVLHYYDRNTMRVLQLDERCKKREDLNTRLLSLVEMIGKMRFENTETHVLGKMVSICKDIFKAERVCIFFIRGGEIEIYGKPTVQEKENIYQLIVKHRREPIQNFEQGLYYDEGTAMIPLVRGTRLDGVLSIHERGLTDLSQDEALLLTLAANIICTYLENLEYLQGLTASQTEHDNGIIMSQLHSGKHVKGRLDRRILTAIEP